MARGRAICACGRLLCLLAKTKVMAPPQPLAEQATHGFLYVGTADGLAIYRAARHGTWRRVGHSMASAAVRAIVAADALTLLVAVDGRSPQQSFDGATTWS